MRFSAARHLRREGSVTDAFSGHNEAGTVVRLAPVGEIDQDVVETLVGIISDAAEQSGVTHVIVDLRGVTFLAAAGIRALLEGRAEALRRECTYRVINAGGLVQWVLDATGTAEVLDPCRPGSDVS